MPANDGAEAHIAEGLRERNADALAQAYDRYSSAAYAVFLRVTRDSSVAEDLVQELFIRVWNKARSFDPARGSLGVWILSIARNIAIDHVRSADTRFQNRVRSIDQTDQLSFSYKPQEPESAIDSAKAVRNALSDLNSNQRRVLELAFFEGFSQSEIATHLQEPLGTVKSWMRSGLGRMRTAIKGGVAQ